MAVLETKFIAETGAAALLFAAVFLVGRHVHPLRMLVHDRRSIISFSAGMSAAYVFVHLMPELHGARVALVETVTTELRYEGMAIYFLALIGFLAFYGLEHLRAHLSQSAESAESEESEEDDLAFKVHIGGFGAYVALMAYLLVRSLEGSEASTALYTVAFGCHFLTLEHSLREEHGEAYQRVGRWLLAAMCLAGWAVGVMVALPAFVVALLVAFISGAVIMNSAAMELPSEKDGRFVPFLIGGLFYGLILIPLG